MLAQLALSTLVVLHGSPLSKRYFALASMVDASSFICIGRVIDVIEVQAPPPFERGMGEDRRTVRIGRVAVESVIKGDATTSTVHHEAWGTWMCDTTSAEIGQRALFFLGPGCLQREPEHVQRVVHDTLRSDLVLRNVGSGDGILDIRARDGEQYVFGAGAPFSLRSERVKYGSRLDILLAYVRQVVEFAPERLTVLARSGRPDISGTDSTFDLRILPDGRARLATNLGPREDARTFSLPGWNDLRRELELSVAGQQRVVGTPGEWNLARKLSLSFPDGSLVFAEPTAGLVLDDTKAQRRAWQDALYLWGRLQTAIECASCRDWGEIDRAVLERR